MSSPKHIYLHEEIYYKQESITYICYIYNGLKCLKLFFIVENGSIALVHLKTETNESMKKTEERIEEQLFV